MFQGSSKGVSRKIKGRFKGILKKFKEKGILRQFQRRFEEVSKKVLVCFKKIEKKTSKVLQECFIEVLLHGSYRSYLSRRRACFLQ